MHWPNLADTIVAVSSGWQAGPVGILRLSGPDCARLLRDLGLKPAPQLAGRARCTAARLPIADTTVPLDVFSFPGPHSYTGQDVVELHTVGSLPLLRELSARLIELGARRALPGEFTTRALANGRMDASAALAVLDLMQAEHQADLRRAARLARGEQQAALEAWLQRLLDVLAQVEAGIDFTDEEDVRFISPAELHAALTELHDQLESRARESVAPAHAGRPHVALVGLPNAGKSTLFNALLGRARAIVSPVLGTTRDVLSAEVSLGSMTVVMQDCAGLGTSTSELEEAAHNATEHASAQADLVLWVHASDQPWLPRETEVCRLLGPERCVLVASKLDLATNSMPAAAEIAFADRTAVCALSGKGLEALRAIIRRQLSRTPEESAGLLDAGDLRAAQQALSNALQRIATDTDQLANPELVSLELRTAHQSLSTKLHAGVTEELLGRIYNRFCVGK